MIQTHFLFVFGAIAAAVVFGWFVRGVEPEEPPSPSLDIATAMLCPFSQNRMLHDGIHIDCSDPECDADCARCVADHLDTLRQARTNERITKAVDGL